MGRFKGCSPPTRGGEWRNASVRYPCPVCGHDSWCSINDGAGVVCCRRMPSGDHRIDKSEGEYWVHYLHGERPTSTPRERVAPTQDRAPNNVLDDAYNAILTSLPLSGEHRNQLLQRGLHMAAIDRGMYSTLSINGRGALYRVAEQAVGSWAYQVPGVARSRDGYLIVRGPGGLIVPCRDLHGRVLALKVRRDAPNGGPRYLYITSSAGGGPSARCSVHVPFKGVLGADVVRVTEGELKADVATVLSGTWTISVPGVGSWAQAVPVIQEIRPKQVLIAFDADRQTNQHVDRAARSLHRSLRALGFDVIDEKWPIEQGKGIDDYLLNHRQNKAVVV